MFLGPNFFPNGPSKFQMGHQNLDFCMQMNGTWAINWPIFMAHPYSGPEITLQFYIQNFVDLNQCIVPDKETFISMKLLLFSYPSI